MYTQRPWKRIKTKKITINIPSLKKGKTKKNITQC